MCQTVTLASKHSEKHKNNIDLRERNKLKMSMPYFGANQFLCTKITLTVVSVSARLDFKAVYNKCLYKLLIYIE